MHETKHVAQLSFIRPTPTTDTEQLIPAQHRAADALCGSCGRGKPYNSCPERPPPKANAFHFWRYFFLGGGGGCTNELQNIILKMFIMANWCLKVPQEFEFFFTGFGICNGLKCRSERDKRIA